MQHIKVTFFIEAGARREMLLAALADTGYDGFEETENELLAYADELHFSDAALQELAADHNIPFAKEMIPGQNWNALWEANFDPVVVAGFCTIRADFHDVKVATPYEIIITPKMSFGTGHHATTQLMMQLMHELPFEGTRVFDFGTGTGVLAILASMLGAHDVLAIDNDEWSVTNARENVLRNRAGNITILQGSAEDAGAQGFDVILANINRHILLQYMPLLYKLLKTGGMILMSGVLKEDEKIMLNATAEAGFIFNKVIEKNSWIALLFSK